ncbi:hypothetical protein ACIQCF_09835 [Streptomyces sp. NPDC088353]|uniref:hypothetical protein n=1 Tax=unclassified Streptomyces TaxID=2593676 RepID=UPI0036BB8920
MRVIGVVSAALLGVGALTFCAPAAVASGGDGRTYGNGGGDSRSYGGGGGNEERYGGGGGSSYGGNGRSGYGGDDEGRFGGRGGGGGGSEHFQHGVRAGVGGTVAGFDLKQIGLGAALIGGSIGTAYRLSRRRTGEEGAA